MKASVSSRRLRWIALASLLLASSFASVVMIRAANPSSATITVPGSVSWTGTTVGTGVDVVAFTPKLCVSTAQWCDLFNLTVTVPSGLTQNYLLNVTIFWGNSNFEDDLYVYYQGSQVGISNAGPGPVRQVVLLSDPPAGLYNIYSVSNIAPPQMQYTGHAALSQTSGTIGSQAPSPATYVNDTAGKSGSSYFTFTPDLRLVGSLGQPGQNNAQNAEPEVAVSNGGTIYVAAIQGVPAGTDFWRSTNGGTSFTYLGQPDGTQINQTAALSVGLGGGDEDLRISQGGTLYLLSLWLGSTSLLTSANGGHNWNTTETPVPEQDRPWGAVVGAKTFYFTTDQLGADLTLRHLILAKSTDGGSTYTQGAAINVTPPVGNLSAGDQGPLVAGPDGSIYNAFDDANGNIWAAACPAPCNLPTIVPNGFTSSGPITLHKVTSVGSTAVFPVVGVDSAGNVYLTYSDGHNVYLSYSLDGGVVWSAPVRVNNGEQTLTGALPWLVAGSAGRVGIMWYGTDSNQPTGAGQWKLFYAMSPNADTPTPTFFQVAASGGGPVPSSGVVHQGVICEQGLNCNVNCALVNPPNMNCAAYNRNLAEYSSMTVDPRTGLVDMIVTSDYNTSNGLPRVDFIRQTAGLGLFAPANPVTITSLQTLNAQGGPQTVFAPGQTVEVKMGLSVASGFSSVALSGIQVGTGSGRVLTTETLKSTLQQGSEYITFEFQVPSGAQSQTYTITGFVWNGFPSQEKSSFTAFATPVTTTIQVT